MDKVTICPICQNTILPEKLEVDEEILSWLSQLRETKTLQSWLFYCKTIHEQAMRGTTAQIVAENIGVFQKQFESEIEYMQEQQRKFREEIQRQQMQFREEMSKLIEENLSRQRAMTNKELAQFSEVLNKIASGLLERTSVIDEQVRKQTAISSKQMAEFSETLNKIASGITERISTSLSEMATTFSTNLSRIQNEMLANFTSKFGEISTNLARILKDLAELARQPPTKIAKEREMELYEELCQTCENDYFEHIGGPGKPDIIAKPRYEGVEIGRTVVFEVKDRGTWRNEFIEQLKRYMEEYHTPFGILATRDLPAESEVKGFSVSVDRYGVMLICKYEYGALAYQILRKLLIALYLEGKETMDFQALFKDEEIIGLLEEAKGYTRYIRSIRRNLRNIEKDLNKMQEELDKKLEAVTYKIAMLQKT